MQAVIKQGPEGTKNAPVTPGPAQDRDARSKIGGNADVTKNVGTVDRVLRISLGGALAAWALARLLSGGALVGQLGDVAMIALGVDFVVTGIRGYCPLYKRLGWSTATSRVRR